MEFINRHKFCITNILLNIVILIIFWFLNQFFASLLLDAIIDILILPIIFFTKKFISNHPRSKGIGIWEEYKIIILPSIIVSAFSLISIISDKGFYNLLFFDSNLIACIVLGIPTWLIFYLAFKAINKINNSIYIKPGKKEIKQQHDLIPKKYSIVIFSSISIVCFIFLIFGGCTLGKLIKHHSFKPFLVTFFIYLGFWLILGIIFLFLITRYCINHNEKELVIHLHFLEIWNNPIYQLLSSIGLEITALSVLSFKIAVIDRMMFYFLYMSPMLTNMSIVLNEWYTIKNKINSDTKNKNIIGDLNSLIHRHPSNRSTIKDQESFNTATSVVKLQHELHLNQSQFSKLVGVPHSTISRIENGDVNPSTQLLGKIAYRTHKHLKIQFV